MTVHFAAVGLKVGLGSVSWWCSSSSNIQISLRVAEHDTWLRRNSRQLAIFPMHLFLSYPSVLLPWLPVISALQCLLCQVWWKLILIMVLISSSSCGTVYSPLSLSPFLPSHSLPTHPAFLTHEPCTMSCTSDTQTFCWILKGVAVLLNPSTEGTQ